MKKSTILSLLLLAVLSLSLMSYLNTDRKALVGKWRWVEFIDAQSGAVYGPLEMTQGAAKEVRSVFKEDNTYLEEQTSASDNTISTGKGEWSFDEEKQLININYADRTGAYKVVELKADTLTVEHPHSGLVVLVREK